MAPSDLVSEIREARALTDSLFGLIKPEALFDRPIAERHRFIFYLGHLEAFDSNLVAPRAAPSSLDKLFAFGIDPTDGQLPDDKASDWPSEEQVRAYALRARDRVDSATRVPATLGAARGDLELLMNVMVEHRLMHAETLAYAMSRLPLDRKAPQPAERHTPASVPSHAAGPVEIPAGPATLGRRRDAAGFGWDNEYEEHQVDVPAFAIDRVNVTNAQYMQFVLAGGYKDKSVWSPEAWSWIDGHGIQHPAFWIRQDEKGEKAENGGKGEVWKYRAMFAHIPLPADWPVYVSHAEASAYAKWRGASLPTEPQWHRAACATRRGAEFAEPEYERRMRDGNVNMIRWDPEPVGARPATDSDHGVADLAGNGWEWTSTPFAPFAGFEPFPFYPGYSADFFPKEGPNGVHYVMKGASPRTAARLVRRSFRNWFQPLYPHVFATFRCVHP